MPLSPSDDLLIKSILIIQLRTSVTLRAMKKVLIFLAIFAIVYSTAAVGDEKQFDPEELAYFKMIGKRIAKYMCRHLDEIFETLNVTQSDLL